jgi:hypothetical protein
MERYLALADGESLLRLWYWLRAKTDRSRAEDSLLMDLADELIARHII